MYLNANRVEAGLQRHSKEDLGYELFVNILLQTQLFRGENKENPQVEMELSFFVYFLFTSASHFKVKKLQSTKQAFEISRREVWTKLN